MDDDKKDEKMEREGLLTLLQNIRANSENHMRQQWTTSYYVLLLYAGIIGIQKLIYVNNKCLIILATFILVLLSIGVYFFSFYIIYQLEKSIILNRKITFNIYKKFKKINDLIKNHTGEDGVSLKCLFYVVNGIGCFLTLCVLIMHFFKNNG